MTTSEIAKILGITTTQARNLISSGALVGEKVGSYWQVDENVFKTYHAQTTLDSAVSGTGDSSLDALNILKQDIGNDGVPVKDKSKWDIGLMAQDAGLLDGDGTPVANTMSSDTVTTITDKTGLVTPVNFDKSSPSYDLLDIVNRIGGLDDSSSILDVINTVQDTEKVVDGPVVNGTPDTDINDWLVGKFKEAQDAGTTTATNAKDWVTSLKPNSVADDTDVDGDTTPPLENFGETAPASLTGAGIEDAYKKELMAGKVSDETAAWRAAMYDSLGTTAPEDGSIGAKDANGNWKWATDKADIPGDTSSTVTSPVAKNQGAFKWSAEWQTQPDSVKGKPVGEPAPIVQPKQRKTGPKDVVNSWLNSPNAKAREQFTLASRAEAGGAPYSPPKRPVTADILEKVKPEYRDSFTYKNSTKAPLTPLTQAESDTWRSNAKIAHDRAMNGENNPVAPAAKADPIWEAEQMALSKVRAKVGDIEYKRQLRAQQLKGVI